VLAETLIDGCWEWHGARDKDGYGMLRWQYRMIRAHVAA
jgi:hypothetical protein